MLKSKSINYTKQNISKQLSIKTGLSYLYCSKITDDLIFILQLLIQEDNLNIKNFGTFKKLVKEEREGRNPKTKENYKIKPRKSISFSISKALKNEINKT